MSNDPTFPRMSALFIGGPKDGQRELVDKPPPREFAATPDGRYVWASTIQLEARYLWQDDTPTAPPLP